MDLYEQLSESLPVPNDTWTKTDILLYKLITSVLATGGGGDVSKLNLEDTQLLIKIAVQSIADRDFSTATNQAGQLNNDATIINHLNNIYNHIYTLNQNHPGTSQATMANSSPVVIASDQSSIPVTPQATESHLGSVGGHSKNITPAINTTAVAYSIGDCIGGVLTLAMAARVANLQTLLQSLHVKDANNQKQPFSILLFDSNPVNATTADNAAFAYGADFSKQIGIINISASDYISIDTKACAPISGLGRVYTPSGSTDLYAVIVAGGTPTFGANATSLFVTFGFLQD
ncbi:MAG: hypothetical protein A3F72_15280 [Bacteroidetes bacterium RIFCSPLOWO2_12_FULL_35_15]|nr:MAG: hypothetical protein A3F72_15280 [Bacteroidetes bacterium RIFCSPLOWO2_12_FULL_35_15]